MEADTLEKVIEKAAEEGDLPAYMEGVGKILEHMSAIAGDDEDAKKPPPNAPRSISTCTPMSGPAPRR